jgi:hypothetical protein
MVLLKKIPVRKRRLIPALGRFSPSVTDYKYVHGLGDKKIVASTSTRRLFPLLGKLSPEIALNKTLGLQKDRDIFLSYEYDSPTLQGRERMAFEDAKLNARFYRDLIKAGVYPEGTKVKVKQHKRWDGVIYQLHFWMPVIATAPSGYLPKEYFAKANSLEKKAEEIAKRYGYNKRLSEDFCFDRNYGVQNGQLRYLDLHVLDDYLPYKGRRSASSEPNKPENPDGKKEKKTVNLEEKIAAVLLICGLFVLLFSMPSVTGDYALNLNPGSWKWLALGICIIASLIGIHNFLLKKQ